MRVSDAFGILVLLCAATARAQTGIDVTVRISVPSSPTSVELQRESDQHVIAMHPEGTTFSADVLRPTPGTGASTLAEPYRLVATWVDGREQVFLGFRATGPDNLVLTMFRGSGVTSRAELDKIDQLGSDFVSTLEKYFRARAFHQHWRFQAHQPNHASALRSARIWFDAAATLATGSNSYFRMDSDIEGFMRSYEELARRDRNFAERYRKYASSGYVDAMLDQVQASPYSLVAVIPDLVRRGELDTAQVLNDSALSSLAGASRELRAAVARNQGVTVNLLRNNAAFIDARRNAM